MAMKKAKKRSPRKAKKKSKAKSATRKKKKSPAKKSVRRVAAKKPMKKPASTGAPSMLPDMEVEATGGKRFRLSSLKGKPLILYFYPKDDTPGCTQEGCDLRDHFPEFQQRNVTIYGISRDSLASHDRFREKYRFPFDLISDPNENLCRAFGVMKEKNLYGNIHIGVERSTFVFDANGKLVREYRGVKVPGHIADLVADISKN